MPASRAVSVARPARARSAVTNGKRLHVIPPGDNKWGRRFADVLTEICSDLGGADQLSEGQRQIARRATTLCIACERMECEAAAGAPFDVGLYGELSDRLGRAFNRLGLKRQQRDVTPTLSEYLAAKAAAEPQDAFEDEADNEAAAEGELPSDSPRPSERASS